jgi:hypothetical protein
MDDEHPCGMLAFSDKWWMKSSDDRHGRTEEQSCVPVQMRGERWYKYSVQGKFACQRLKEIMLIK